MSDIQGGEMTEREGRFEGVLLEGLLECAFEVEEAFVYMVMPLI